MRLCVCIVDDDLDIRDSLRILFEDMDAIVEEAPDGEVALSLLRAHAAPRVVLLDHLMPHLDGMGVLRALALAPDLQRRTAILFMTAHREPLTAGLTTLLTAVGGAILRKPFEVDVLLGQVEQSWQRLIASV